MRTHPFPTAYVYLLTGGLILATAGCGEPDLNQMKPTVSKPAAVIFLVDHPPGWNPTDVQSYGTAAGVTTQVQNVSSAALYERIQSALKTGQVGLVMVVEDNTVPGNIAALPAQFSSTRFEFVSTEAAAQNTNNLRQVTPNLAGTAYVLGWVAGQLGLAYNMPNATWVLDGTPQASKQRLQNAAGGVYASNTSLQLTPWSFSTGAAPAGTTNSTNANTTSPVAGSNQTSVGTASAGTALVPPSRLWVAGGPLSPAIWNVAASQGASVVSLCVQPSTTNLAAEPVLPDESVLQDDIAAFANGSWEGGTKPVANWCNVWLNTALVPGTVGSMVKQVEQSVQTDPGPATNAWNRIPPTVQQVWGGWLG